MKTLATNGKQLKRQLDINLIQTEIELTQPNIHLLKPDINF